MRPTVRAEESEIAGHDVEPSDPPSPPSIGTLQHHRWACGRALAVVPAPRIERIPRGGSFRPPPHSAPMAPTGPSPISAGNSPRTTRSALLGAPGRRLHGHGREARSRTVAPCTAPPVSKWVWVSASTTPAPSSPAPASSWPIRAARPAASRADSSDPFPRPDQGQALGPGPVDPKCGIDPGWNS